jgi:hypothetical protein
MNTYQRTSSVILNGQPGSIIQTFEQNEDIGLGPSCTLTSTEFVPAPAATDPQYKFERVGSVRLCGVQHKTYQAYVRLQDGAWQLHQTIYAPMRMPKRDLPTLLHFDGDQ